MNLKRHQQTIIHLSFIPFNHLDLGTSFTNVNLPLIPGISRSSQLEVIIATHL